jgi:NAD(P)-dependent dehydrogenase (short-subunit alcohol dehydrogenase family)
VTGGLGGIGFATVQSLLQNNVDVSRSNLRILLLQFYK